jgi:hypothetical protein
VTEYRWQCVGCDRQWSDVVPELEIPCETCGSTEVKRITAPVLPEIESVLRAYVADVEEIVDVLTEAAPADATDGALRDMAAIRETLRREALKTKPASFVEHGRVADSGIGWICDSETYRERERFFAANGGKRIRHIYEVVEEPNDTERPPAPMFTQEEPDTFSPVTSASADADELDEAPKLGRLVPRFEQPEQLRWKAGPGDVSGVGGEGGAT